MADEPQMSGGCKSVRVEYFAILRDQRGCAEETVETRAETPREFYAELQKRHGLSLQPDSMRVAVNGEFQPWETPLRTNDEVAFIPPVAGG